MTALSTLIARRGKADVSLVLQDANRSSADGRRLPGSDAGGVSDHCDRANPDCSMADLVNRLETAADQRPWIEVDDNDV